MSLPFPPTFASSSSSSGGTTGPQMVAEEDPIAVSGHGWRDPSNTNDGISVWFLRIYHLNAPGDTREFIQLNEGTGNGLLSIPYILREDLHMRIVPDNEAAAIKMFQNDHQKSLPVLYDSSGRQIPTLLDRETRASAKLATTGHLGDWAWNIVEQWREAAYRAQQGRPSQGFDPASRFWRPWPTNGGKAAPASPKPLNLYIVPIGGTTVAALETAFKTIYDDKNAHDLGVPKELVKVQALPPPGGEIVSTDFFKMWSLYVEKGQRAVLFGTVIRPWEYGFPTVPQLQQFHKDFFSDKDSLFRFQDSATWSSITPKKVGYADGRKREVTQQSVMNHASASYFGRPNYAPSYPDKYIPSLKYGAEWLHRSAFSFGGFVDVSGNVQATLQSSQAVQNLVYGLYEANTMMLRAESAIKAAIRADPRRTFGLRTQLLSGGIIKANRPTFADGAEGKAPDAEFLKAQYSWFSPQLSYSVSEISSRVRFGFLAGEQTFSLLSRQTPLALEVAFDAELIKAYFTPATSSSSSSLSGSLSSFSSSPSSSLPMRFTASVPATSSLFVSSPSTLALVPPHAAPAPLVKAALSIGSNPYDTSASTTTADPHVTIPTASIHRPVAALVRIPSAMRKDLVPDPHTLSPSALTAWTAAQRSVSALQIHGLSVMNPTVVRMAVINAVDEPAARAGVASVATVSSVLAVKPGTPPPPDGFVLTGDINPFSIANLKAKLYSWHGPSPAWVHPTVGLAPMYLMAKLPDDLKLSTIIPLLKSTLYDKLNFKNTSFTYQNYNFDKDKDLGLHIDADIDIDSSFGILHDILVTAFKIPNPKLHVHGALGGQTLKDPLKITSFVLEGIFAGIRLRPFDGLELTEIGLRLYGIPSASYPDWTMRMRYDFSINGKMTISAPGGPLALDYSIGGGSSMAHLQATVMGEVWPNAFGVKGMNLDSLNFNASFDTKQPLKTLQFDVEAAFDGDTVTAFFLGSYSPGGAYHLTATVQNFGFDGVLDVFKHIGGGTLQVPNVDIDVGSATLEIQSGTLSVTVSRLKVSSFAALDVVLIISSAGVMLQGNLIDDTLSLHDIDIKKAYVKVDIAKSGSGRTSDVVLGGEVLFQGITIDAIVHLYPSSDSNKGIEWTVVGAVSSSGDLSLSSLIPELKGSFMDGIVLRSASLIVASKDDPSLGAVLSKPYPVKKGVQVCAELGELPALNSLTRSSTPGLLLQAGWSLTTGFTLDIVLPTPSTVNLGRGITTDPFKLRIETKPPMLELIAGIKIPVPKQSEPLDFSMSLSFNLIEAIATGQLHGYWNNPFGISDRVKIGPDLALSIDIIFAQFVSTGTPSGLGFVGGLQIGKTSAQVAFQVSEDPSREVLKVDVKKLDINDVVSLACDVTKLNIPQPPNFLDFEDVSLYICPVGTTIGTIVYPQGFSFSAVMVIFGKRADIACAISTSDLKIAGGVDNFSLGPLVVQGQNGPRATLDIQIGTTVQMGHVDGLVELFDVSASISINFSVLPSPTFQFDMVLHFTALLTFSVHAALIGKVTDLSNLSNLDFEFLAVLQQHILDYVNEQLQAQFELAKHAADEGIASAQAKVSAAQRDADAGIAAAQKALDAAFASWQAKSDAVHKSSQRVIDDYNAQFHKLTDGLNAAKASFDAATQRAQKALQDANNERGRKLANAQATLTSAQNDWANRIRNAQQDVDNAERKTNNDIKDAQDKVNSAKSAVDSLQGEIDATQRDIDKAKSNPIPIPIPPIHWPPFSIPNPFGFIAIHAAVGPVAALGIADGGVFSLPVLEAKLGTLQASKLAADGVLIAAKAVLTGSAIAADQVAFAAARATLDTTTKSGAAAIEAAKKSVQLTDQATAAAINAAQAAIEAAKKGPEAVAYQAAQQALSSFQAAGAAALRAAQQAVDALIQSSEWFAYQSASAGLSAAKQVTPALQAANGALGVAKDATNATLSAAAWIAKHGASLFNIQEIRLSGALKAIATGGEAFSAEIKGEVAAKPFDLKLGFDPRKTGEFLGAIFKHLWDEIKTGKISF